MSTKTEIRAKTRSAKRDEVRRELAEYAITALAEIGYANLAMRDIALSSGVSLGKLQYYFEDKEDLLLFCIDIHVERFIAGLSGALEVELSPEAARAAYIEALTQSVIDNSRIHRLWYDIRNQALFDAILHDKVEGIEASYIEICEELAAKFGMPRNSGLSLYLAMDSVYRYCIQRLAYGRKMEPDQIRHLAQSALERRKEPLE
ncbi:TetR/AcrR family transcriptional regulator [Ruegeria sp. Ofav3-42]|uniref:TetR/AcrR family transcriptional regulator n=1 Tax=Ruegeria sp. Ofav3-42 TaxID=2917759 RepID=UPI001EF6611C|nr:TetR/AcrR family transcriptional regulator [Ruegeria sp. Ofav3-42]MCG7522045.1 TetR/AcrR family transcriptional regulator [Ruegeria sp. Ofav3-42]